VTAGRFLVFEGIDGAGKSTQIEALVAWLTAQGVSVLATREPGGTPVGEAIRAVVLNQPMHPETELLLLCAARREHLLTRIVPALAAGQWVISDRFADASYAYQVAGRGVPATRFAVLDEWTRGGVTPDLVILFDIPAELAAARRIQRGKEQAPDRFENESLPFFDRVRRAYLERAAADRGRYLVLDATQPPEVLTELLLAEVTRRWFPSWSLPKEPVQQRLGQAQGLVQHHPQGEIE
jgi:dTMP kinase